MQPAPEFRITAAVSERVVTAHEGRRQVLVFHGPRTTDAPKAVGKAVRAAFPKAEDVLVANVVDLRTMGGMWRRVAEAGIKSTYDKMAPKVPDPAEYVVICPDWEGAVSQAFGLEDPNKEPAAVVLDAGGNIVGVARGEGLEEQVLGWLR